MLLKVDNEIANIEAIIKNQNFDSFEAEMMVKNQNLKSQ